MTLAMVMATRADAAASEAQVKAAYLYKLASFVRWPSTAFPDASAPLHICVAGPAEVYSAIEVMTRGQEASGRQLEAAQVDPGRSDGGASCHILFVGQNDSANRALLAQIGQRPVLTVSDRTVGIRGGVIEFIRAGGNVRFVIHRRAADVRQLILSSKLLTVAASVEP